MCVLQQVPADRLVKLLTVLQWNIRDGTKVTPIANQGQVGQQALYHPCTVTVFVHVVTLKTSTPEILKFCI